MNAKSLLAASLLFAAPAFADELTTAPTAPPPAKSDNLDRLFPLSQSAGTNPTLVRSQTTGSAGGGEALGVGETVEFVPIDRLSIRAGADFRPDEGFTPSAQVKFQFLAQDAQGLNASVGANYKMVGLQPDGGEVEGFLAAGRSFGKLLATANFAMGRGLGDPDMDVEGHLALGYKLSSNFLVGANARGRFLLGDPAQEQLARGGSPNELTVGAVGAYTAGFFEASVLAGWQQPVGLIAPGALVVATIGLNF